MWWTIAVLVHTLVLKTNTFVPWLFSESEYQDDFSSNSTSERSSHSNSKSSEKTITPSQGETPEEETIATDEDVSFGDIISDASQVCSCKKKILMIPS